MIRSHDQKLHFGKFKGWTLDEVPSLGYIIWLAGWKIIDGKRVKLDQDNAHTWVCDHHTECIGAARKWLIGRCWHCGRKNDGPEWHILHKLCWFENKDHNYDRREEYNSAVSSSNDKKRIVAIAMSRQTRLGARSCLAWLPHEIWVEHIVPMLKEQLDTR